MCSRAQPRLVLEEAIEKGDGVGSIRSLFVQFTLDDAPALKAHAHDGGAVVFTSHQSFDLGDGLNILDLEQFRGE